MKACLGILFFQDMWRLPVAFLMALFAFAKGKKLNLDNSVVCGECSSDSCKQLKISEIEVIITVSNS